MRRVRGLSALVCISLFLNISTSQAQTMPPANVDPGAVGKATGEYLSGNIAKQTEDKTKEESIKAPEPEKTETKEVHIEKFQLKKVVFTGNTVYKSSELEKLAKNIIGKDVSIDDINNLAAEITKQYRINGYLTSFAYIPTQTINDGTLELKVFEGKVGDITIKGNKWTKTSYFRNNIFKANDFEQNTIFNLKDLQKSLQQINNTEYLKGQVTMQKGVKPETTDITLDVKERLPFSLGASWDNMGRELIGVQRANIILADNNLTGFGDSLSAGVSLAQRTFGVNSGYSLPLGPYGTKLNFGYSFSNVNIGGSFEQLNIKGISHMFHPYLTQPIYKNDNTEINSSLAFDFINSKTTLLDMVDLQKYNLRVLRLDLNGIREDNRGRWISNAEISTGIPLFGATSTSGYGLASSKFFKFTANLIRVQALPFRTTGIVRFSGQFSPNALLAPEQMQIGGMYSVRGFDEGLLLGDLGYTASVELRHSVPYLPDFSIPYWKHKKFDVNLKDRIQLAAFYDQGFAKAIHQEVPTSYLNFLQGIGAGIRIQLSKFVSANIDMGVPLGRDRSANQKDVKLHFGLSGNLF